jgi:hypothetical protein
MYRFCLASCFVIALVWSCGCSPAAKQGGAPAATVKGTVTLDKKPVPAGEIHFGPAGAPPTVLEIRDGAFSGEAPVGKNQVEVYIFVEGAPSEKYGGLRTKTNTAPQKYWGPNTTLSATVNTGEANAFKFDLTSR